ncbi:MAG: hypothetical protein M0Z63_00440, partial [Actinomycetota bacterium]|nr:hypothetical protein [Actinomycetota bacterium]
PTVRRPVRARRTVPGRRDRSTSGAARRGGAIGASGQDVVRLITDYLKQETVGPLRGAARFVAFGVVGSLAISGGAVLLLIALLRLLQGETGDAFGGDRSWLPYLITAVAALAVLALSVWRVASGAGRRRASVPSTRNTKEP